MPTQYPEFLSSEVKQPESEADHSPPFTADVKNGWSNTSTTLHMNSCRAYGGGCAFLRACRSAVQLVGLSRYVGGPHDKVQ